jgi:pimeloyl-ACP methyl ester carboxylesterase
MARWSATSGRSRLFTVLSLLAITPGWAAMRTLSGTLADGTDYRIDYPDNFNGTVLLGLDYAASNPASLSAEALLGRGYALAGTTRLVTGWALRESIANQVATLDAFEASFGRARHSVVFGSSLGGHTGAAVVQARPDRFDGAVLQCGGLSGEVAMWNSKLDALWIAKALIAPGDDSLPVINIPADFATTARPAWISRLNEAQKTPAGRARIALAAVIGQLPTWSVATKAQPTPNDVTALQEGLYDSLAGGPLPLIAQAMSSRFEIETKAGGNISSNEGVNYSLVLAQMRNAWIVRALYKQAGLDLKADLAALAKTPRIKADSRAIAWTASGNWTGRVTVPVLTLSGVGDQIALVSGQRYYEQIAGEAGYSRNVRQLYTNSAGHCAFSAAEIVTTVQILRDRLDTGKWQDTSAAAANTHARALALGESRFVDLHPAEVARPFPVRISTRMLEDTGAGSPRNSIDVELIPRGSGGKTYRAQDIDVDTILLEGSRPMISRTTGRSLKLVFSTDDLKGVHPGQLQTLVINGSFTDGFTWLGGGQAFVP